MMNFFRLPTSLIVVILTLVALAFIIWIWALIDCLSSRLSTIEKFFWVLIIIFFPVIGALIYLIFAKEMSRKGAMKPRGAGRRLLRSRRNRVIAGVCGGLGNYARIDPTVIRLLWVLFTIVSFGTALIVYIIAWVIIPEEK